MDLIIIFIIDHVKVKSIQISTSGVKKKYGFLNINPTFQFDINS